MGMLLIAYVTIVSTVFSISAIATSANVEKGGVYCILKTMSMKLTSVSEWPMCCRCVCEECICGHTCVHMCLRKHVVCTNMCLCVHVCIHTIHTHFHIPIAHASSQHTSPQHTHLHHTHISTTHISTTHISTTHTSPPHTHLHHTHISTAHTSPQHTHLHSIHVSTTHTSPLHTHLHHTACTIFLDQLFISDLISRSLGPEFGGAAGIIFYVANLFGCASYIIGETPSFQYSLPGTPPPPPPPPVAFAKESV